MIDQEKYDEEIDSLISTYLAGKRVYQKIDKLWIGITNGRISVSGYLLSINYYKSFSTMKGKQTSVYTTIEEIPRYVAKSEIDEIIILFNSLLSKSEKLKVFIFGYPIDYYLLFDYGKEAYLVCSYEDGIYKEYV